MSLANNKDDESSAHLLEIFAEPPLEEVGVLIEQIYQEFVKSRDRITPALYVLSLYTSVDD